MGPTQRSWHPDTERLRRYVHGTLGSREMDRVSSHLLSCDACCQAALMVPDDRIASLLRRQGAGVRTEVLHGSCPP